jgi:hypothetical protein
MRRQGPGRSNCRAIFLGRPRIKHAGWCQRSGGARQTWSQPSKCGAARLRRQRDIIEFRGGVWRFSFWSIAGCVVLGMLSGCSRDVPQFLGGSVPCDWLANNVQVASGSGDVSALVTDAVSAHARVLLVGQPVHADTIPGNEIVAGLNSLYSSLAKGAKRHIR